MNIYSRCPLCGKFNDHDKDGVSPIAIDGQKRFACLEHFPAPPPEVRRSANGKAQE